MGDVVKFLMTRADVIHNVRQGVYAGKRKLGLRPTANLAEINEALGKAGHPPTTADEINSSIKYTTWGAMIRDA